MNEHTIEHDTKTHRNKEKYDQSMHSNPNKKGKFPIGVANFVTEKNFLWLGVDHMRQYDTRNQSIIKYDRYIK